MHLVHTVYRSVSSGIPQVQIAAMLVAWVQISFMSGYWFPGSVFTAWMPGSRSLMPLESLVPGLFHLDAGSDTIHHHLDARPSPILPGCLDWSVSVPGLPVPVFRREEIHLDFHSRYC